MSRIWSIGQLFGGAPACDGKDSPMVEAVTQPYGLIIYYPDACGQYLTGLALFAARRRQPTRQQWQ